MLDFRYPLRKVKIRDGRKWLSLIKEKREMFMTKICPLCGKTAEASDSNVIEERKLSGILHTAKYAVDLNFRRQMMILRDLIEII